MVKNLLASVGDIRDTGSISRCGRSPGEGHGNPLQFSCLENPMDRGAWRATVHGVTESDTTEWLTVIVVDKYGSILSTVRNGSGFLQGSQGAWLFKKNTWIYLIFYTPTYTYIGICVCILVL